MKTRVLTFRAASVWLAALSSAGLFPLLRLRLILILILPVGVPVVCGQNVAVDGAFDAQSQIETVFRLLRQPDGRVVVSSLSVTTNGTTRFGVLRLDADGARDVSFGAGAELDGPAWALARQSDGRILLGGQFSTVSGVPRRGLARLNPDGTLDAEFHPELGASDGFVMALAIQGDERIVCGGPFTSVNGFARPGLVRLHSDGTVDTGFNPGSGPNLGIEVITIDTAGRILIAGNFSQLGGLVRHGLARLATNGTPDAAFAPELGSYPGILALALQADGKILAGGWSVSSGGVVRRLVRLHSDGSVDTGFDLNLGSGFTRTSTSQSTVVRALAVQPDGGILVGGEFTRVNDHPSDRLARLLPGGAIDVNFDPGSFQAGLDSICVCGLGLAGEGRILVGGNFRTINGLAHPAIARLAPVAEAYSGRAEFAASWVQVGEADSVATLTIVRERSTNGALTVQYSTADASAVAGEDYMATNGTVTFAPGETNKTLVVPVLNDLRAEWGEGFTVVLGTPASGGRLGEQSQISVVVVDDDTEVEFGAGSFRATENLTQAVISVERRGSYMGPMTVRYAATAGTATPGVDFQEVTGIVSLAEGSAGGTFAVPILADQENEWSETIQLTLFEPSSPVTLGGRSNATLVIVEVGTVDSRFGPGSGPDAALDAILIAPGNAILIHGDNLTRVGGTSRPGLARLHPDGSLDASFVPELDGPAQAVVAASDGSVLVRTGIGLNTRVLRLRADGTWDRAYQTPFPFEEEYPLALQVDGKLIEYRIYSDFATAPGFVTNRLLRLNAGGLADSTFAGNAWIENRQTLRPIIEVLRIQADGKFLVGGRFTHVAGIARSGLARFLPDGSVDPDFHPDLASEGAVVALDLLADGRILVGGGFTNVNGYARPGLARLSPEGELDDSFAPAVETFGDVVSVLVLPEGGALVAGSFVDPTDRRQLGHVLRLRDNGAVDSEFVAASSFDCCMAALALQSDGGMLLGGSFDRLQDTQRRFLARLKGDPGSGPGTISFRSTSRVVTEGSGTINIEVQRTGGSNGAVTVPYAILPGSASQDSVQPVSGWVGFAAGDDAPKFIRLAILDDAVGEDDELLVVNLGQPIGGATLGAAAVATITVRDDDDCSAIFRYYPLHHGDRKEFAGATQGFSSTVTATTVTARAAMAVTLDGEQYYYAHVGDDLLLKGGSALGYDLIFNEPLVELDASLLLYGGTRSSRTTGTLGDIPLTFTMKTTVKEAGTVTVPAGTFENCRLVTVVFTASARGGPSESSKQSYVLAPGVGQIRISSVGKPDDWFELRTGSVGGSDVRDLAPATSLRSPLLTAQPHAVQTVHGSSAVFQALADGSAPLRYQWTRDGTNLVDGGGVSGATAPTLVIDSAQPGDAGAYAVTVANIVGCTTSSAATLVVVPDQTRPTVSVAVPAANARVSNDLVTIRGSAGDNARVIAVRFQLNDGDWAEATGTTNWMADVELRPGTNLFRAVAVDVAGNLSPTISRAFVRVVTSPLHLTVRGDGTVAPYRDGQLLEVGKRYVLTATPRPGNLFSNWVGNDAAAGPTLAFVMAPNLALTANFVPNPFSELQGSYQGLFCDSNAPAHFNAGAFVLTVTSQGAFSGRLQQGATKSVLRGQFDLALAARISIPRPGSDDWIVGLQLAGGADTVTGTVSNAGWNSEIFGYRAAFSRAHPPGAPLQGRFTALLPGTIHPDEGPVGNGSARLTASSAGVVLFQGTLGDGTSVTLSSALAANGACPIYASLSAGAGSLFGWVVLSEAQTNDVPGRLLWTKPGGIKGAIHSAGFTNELTVLGSRYVVPGPGSRAVDLTNAVVVMSAGNLATPLTTTVLLSERNTFTIAGENPRKLSLKLTTASGLLSGTFLHPETGRATALRGVVLPKQKFGGGAFCGRDESGSFLLIAMDSDP